MEASLSQTKQQFIRVNNEVLINASIDYATVGSFVNVKIDRAEDFDLYGQIVK